MKRALLIGIIAIIIGIILIAIIAVPGIRWLSHNRLAYIERTTGIAFPSTISQIDVSDNMEFVTVAHVKLQETDIESFANKYGFSSTPVDVTHWIETLQSENRTIPSNAALRYLEGRSSSNRWLFALDQNSGRVWAVVFYPDPGGASP